jgi:hypothetical protein
MRGRLLTQLKCRCCVSERPESNRAKERLGAAGEAAEQIRDAEPGCVCDNCDGLHCYPPLTIIC